MQKSAQFNISINTLEKEMDGEIIKIVIQTELLQLVKIIVKLRKDLRLLTDRAIR